MSTDDWLVRRIGPYRTVGDRSWAHGDARVVELRDAGGVPWIVKHHRFAKGYRREIEGYRRWSPVLRDRMPTLCDHDPGRMLLLLSSIPGRPDTQDAATPAIQHQAGRLLRRMHDAAPARPWPEFAEVQRAKFDDWARRGADLLTTAEIDFVAESMQRLTGMTPDVVHCHLDYTPRNWLVGDGVVRVIDFERAAPHVWVQDLNRLYFGMWRDDPAARDAFLAGYGRVPTDDELALLHALGAHAALSTVVWAHEHGDAEYEATGRRNLAALRAGPGR